MTDQPSVILQLEALNLLAGAIVDVRPAIVVRCRDEKLNIFVTTGAVLDADTYDMTLVRIRWGTGTPEELSWSRSTDYSAAFAPDPGVFLKQLLAAPDMRFEFRPFDAAPRVASFNARGLDVHISTLEAACPTLWEPLDSGTGIELRGGVYAEALVEEKPELLSAPQPEYPQVLRAAGIEGTVLVEVVIDTTGRVEPNSLKIIRSPNPAFDRPVKDAMLRALFRPARVHGRAVRVLAVIPLNFTLKK